MNYAFAIFLASLPAFAIASSHPSNDFKNSSSPLKPLSREDIAYRFHVTGEIFAVSSDGEKLLRATEESRDWSFGTSLDRPLVSNWNYQHVGIPTISLRHEWTIEDDGRISVVIRQYDRMTQNRNLGAQLSKVIREQKFTLKDFSPINWVIEDDKKRVIVRFTPNLWTNSDTTEIGSLPISGRNIIVFDNNGTVWGEVDSASGIYFGVGTHMGTLALSYLPFKGAKLIGEAKEGRITIKNGKDKVMIQSERPFLPREVKVHVYGMINLNQKTTRLHSVRSFTSDKEENFLESISSSPTET